MYSKSPTYKPSSFELSKMGMCIWFQQGTRAWNTNVRLEWHGSLPSVSCCWWSFSSAISSHTLAKPGFSSTWTVNFQMFQLDLAKAKKLEVKLPTSVGSSKKQQSSRRTATSALLTVPKPLTVWITTDCGKFFRRWEYQITLPAFWETCMQVRKQQLELDIEQQTGSKLGKVYVRAVYCHPAYLTYR